MSWQPFNLHSVPCFPVPGRNGINTNNQGAARIVQVGSMHFNLHTCILASFCSYQGINLEVDWIPGSLTEKADYLSKIVDFDDWEIWEIIPEIFQLLDNQ